MRRPLGRDQVPIRFHASFVRTSEESWGTLIVLSVDETLEAERYLMIQRKLRFSEEDHRHESADVYIETCGQGWSWYGHIVSFQLLEDHIQVQLDPSAAAAMKDNGFIEVSFALSRDERDTLRTALHRAFEGRPYFVDAAA